MPKVSIIPWSSKKAPDGSVPFYLVIRHEDQRSTIAIEGVRMHPRHWNATRQEVRKTHKHHHKLNLYLKSVVDEAEEVVLDVLLRDGTLTTRAVKELLQRTDKPVAPSFFDYFQKRIDEFRDRSQFGSADVGFPPISRRVS